MWKLIIYYILLMHGSTSLANDNHLLNLQKKFPYSLLSNDFGILDEIDLVINNCAADPTPFSKKNLAFPYWQCFEVNNTEISCIDMGSYENSKQQSALMKIKVHTIEKTAEYINRRGLKMSACLNFKNAWKVKTLNQKHVCLSGVFNFSERANENHESETWTFEKFKTKKGCESYFVGACSLQYLIEHNLCENLKK